MNNELGYVTREAELSLGILVERAKLLEEKVKLLEVENKSLKERELFLLALEASGVDNWSGYSFAFDILKEWEDEAS